MTTVSVVTRTVPRYLTLTGSLTANQESDVAANATGAVLKTNVERGSVVQQGQVLVQLDLRTAELQRTEAAANLESAKQQQALAKQECERAKGLLQRGAAEDVERHVRALTRAVRVEEPQGGDADAVGGR